MWCEPVRRVRIWMRSWRRMVYAAIRPRKLQDQREQEKQKQEQEPDPEQKQVLEEEIGIWSYLPQDVLMKVLAALPLVSLLRARAVCREWKEVASWPSLLQEKVMLQREYPTTLVAIGMARRATVDVSVYHTSSNHWHVYHVQEPQRDEEHVAALGLLARWDPSDTDRRILADGGTVLLSSRGMLPWISLPYAPSCWYGLEVQYVRGVLTANL